MSERIDCREAIAVALRGLANPRLAEASRQFFATLGYASERRLPIATPDEFCAQLDPLGALTPRERTALDQATALHLLFQLTQAELAAHVDLFAAASTVEPTRIESYLFFAVELPPEAARRSALATLVRAINKPLPMPALVLFRHGDTASLGIIHRRLHQRDPQRDVLEKVTLIKDIRFADPLRAHLDILNDFVCANLDADFGVTGFVRLHDAWRQRLGAYTLSSDFYREIADWYFWAHHQREEGVIRLPPHCQTEQEQALFFIRLLTRVIFCGFLVEKRLIPAELFRAQRLPALLKTFSPDADPRQPDLDSSYYHAVLQNLFFGTLNMPPEQRGFRGKRKTGQGYDPHYGVTNLWRYENAFHNPDDWRALAARIPFLNGGLFDCLDDKPGNKADTRILDGFSDNPKLACGLPNELFFGPERTVDLSRDYGEEDRKTARSQRAKVRGLMHILARYKFTIEENTPLEEDIALDPELLGKVFENLLASYNEDTRTTARKALGAFYTPREIVAYMVDEALKAYLSRQVPGCEAALEALLADREAPADLPAATREALIAAIGRVKILDPACGSGAFPMGALHRLVDLLQKLDHNNASWKRDRLAEARRYRELLEQSGAPPEEMAACDARIADIEQSFDTRFHAYDYARKLYLIENCIYGIDIQPIATQIAKLRFFIALVVDQKVDPSAPNLGVRPLPNLETRLVAADALIPIEKSAHHQFDLLDQTIRPFRRELEQARHGHFSARSPQGKRRCRERDADLRQQIADLLMQSGMPAESAMKLAGWNPYDQNASAGFFDPEWMFGLSVGQTSVDENMSATSEPAGRTGFDIVIGNPPYALISGDLFQEKYRDIFPLLSGKPDLYRMFLERCPDLLSRNGCLVFIIPNTILAIPSAARLRKYLMTHYNPGLVIDLTAPVFGAAVNNVILMIERRLSQKKTVHIGIADSLDDFTKKLKMLHEVTLDKWLENHRNEWDIHVIGDASNIIEKIEENSLRVGELTSEIVLGMQVYHNSLHTAEQMKLRIHHSSIKQGENWLAEFGGKDIKGLRLPTQSRFFVNAAAPDIYHKPAQKYFENPRIILREIPADRLVAAYADTTFSVNKSCYIITDSNRSAVEIKSLMAVLISSVTIFWVRKKGDKAKQALFPRITMNTIRKIPVPNKIYEHKNILSRLIDYMLWINDYFSKNPDTQSSSNPLMLAYWEQILNGLVYELYFPEELHDAGLHLFDLVAGAQLPDRDAPPEAERLACLRTLFETLYATTHPLRSALDRLQTLDTVRIIEGKA